MTHEEIMTFIAEAAQSRQRVLIRFSKTSSVYLRGAWKLRDYVIVRFFQSEDNQYGYKINVNSTTGFPIKYLPLYNIQTMCYEEKNDNVKNDFAKYVLMHKHNNVWPDLDKNIDSYIGTRLDRELTKKYLNSFCNALEIEEISNILNEQRKCTYFIGNRLDTYIETDKRASGFYAWLITPKTTWILINPTVAIFGRKRDDG